MEGRRGIAERHGKLWSWESVSVGAEDKDMNMFEQGHSGSILSKPERREKESDFQIRC